MNITVHYIGHSSFLVQTPSVLLLFDYFKGALPPLPCQKPLFVFASHNHGDHFSPAIFNLPHPNCFYILSQDIKYKGFPKALQSNITFVKKHQDYCVQGIHLHTLRSTDKGVAFCLKTDGLQLYHAGDLNHWHWDGEPPSWNNEMGEKYRQELARIAGTTFDLAFVPLDPRLGNAQSLGLREFLQCAQARHLFPMHMWDDFSVCTTLITEFPQLMPLVMPGQVFQLEF